MLELNKIYNMDCLEGLKQISSNSVSLIFTSPPYNVNVQYDVYKDDKPFNEYISWMKQIFVECERVLSPGGHICLQIANTGRQPYIPLSYHLGLILKDMLIMKGEIIWNKQNMTSGTAWGSWLSANRPCIRDLHEYILVFRKEGDRKGKSDMTGDEFMEYTKSIWVVTPETRLPYHPAPFPTELARRIIKLYSFKKEVVLDPFMGAGTTALVAKQLGRKFIGFEISFNYCKIAEDRLKQEVLLGIL